MLKLHNLYKVYRTDEVETVALNGVNLEIAQGDFVAIMGPSGCGKSTLLNIVGMLDNPSDGDYWFFDENVAPYSESQRSAIRKQHIGFIFQSFNLIEELTVAENIELALLYHNMPSGERKQRVAAVMDRMGIAHRANHMPGQLSGGQQQRVAVARAVVGDQPLILADEPTGNLDSEMAESVLELLKEINAAGTTIVMVTHDVDLATRAPREVHVLDGRIKDSPIAQAARGAGPGPAPLNVAAARL